MEKEGKIVRIIPGLYAFPKYSRLLKEYVVSDIGTIAQGIARKNDWKIFPEGNTALLYLGLSIQVPAKYIYLSRGGHRKYDINGTILEFKELNSKTISINDKNTSYIAQAFPQLALESCNIPTVKPIRTFWDKATILHKEFYRPATKYSKHTDSDEPNYTPARYSRHYHDLYQLGNSFVKDEALADRELPVDVVDRKDISLQVTLFV